MKKQIGEHSDHNFVKNASRFFNLERVIESNSWEDFFNLMMVIDDKDYKKTSFGEYKLTALVIHIEQLVIAVLDQLRKDNKVKVNTVKTEVLNSLIRYREKTEDEALEILEKQTEGKETRLINANIFVYISGMGLGNITHLMDVATKNFQDKKRLVEDLRKFNDVRNNITHNSLSSRIDFLQLLDEGLSLGFGIYKKLDTLLGEQLSREQEIFRLARNTN